MKYINYGKKGALTIFDIGKAGLNCTGSKHLLEVFDKHKAEFEAAAKLDAKSLKDERPETAPPPLTTMPSALSNFLNQPEEVKKLEQHLPIMVDHQLLECLHPIIHRELQERGMWVKCIRWGDYKYKPSFWPEDVVPWGLVNNPVHPQKHKLPLPLVEVLKIAVYRCLKAKGIDPRNHVKDDVCPKQIRNKLRSRSLKTIDEAYERFYSLFPLKTESEEAKYVPDESYDPQESFELEEAIEQSEVTEEEPLEHSDDEDMSDDDDEVYSISGKDRAAAITNILNILANASSND